MTPQRRVTGYESIVPFNPLDYGNLTKNFVDELMARGPFKLPLDRPFLGVGVYALFYTGDDHVYEQFRSSDSTDPIYVGKAAAAGARKGDKDEMLATAQLYRRLVQHTTSIQAVENLSIEDFRCRYLVVEPLWVAMAESFLITKFKPLWNLELDGFGNHDPGKGRHAGEITLWDAHHPGRPWAKSLRQTRTREQTTERILDFARRRREDPRSLNELAESVAAADASNTDNEVHDETL